MTRRPTAAALAAVALLAAGPAAAQTSAPATPPAAAIEIDREALVDARVAALRAGLRLAPAQEPLFAPVEEALREAAQGAQTRREGMRGDPAPAELDFMQRVERAASTAQARSEELAALATALRPLWESLDERQRATLPALMGGMGVGRMGEGMGGMGMGMGRGMGGAGPRRGG